LVSDIPAGDGKMANLFLQCRLTRREELQERRFLNDESMAGVPVTVMAGRLTRREELQERRRFINVESMAGVPVKGRQAYPERRASGERKIPEC
jgi:hypothetical protein